MYVPTNYYIPLHKTIYNVIHEQKPGQWNYNEILNHLKLIGNFNSPVMTHYLRENGIRFSTTTYPRHKNPFLKPTTPLPVAERPPQEQTLTPTTPNQPQNHPATRPQTPSQILTPNRTPTPITQAPETTITPATTIPKSPLESVISLPDNPQTQPTPLESGNRNDPDNDTTKSPAELEKVYNNKNKHNNQTDSNQNGNCDNKLRTDVKNTGKPIIQSIQELLTEFRQSQRPFDRTNTRPTAILTPEAIVNPTTPQILTTTPEAVPSLTTPSEHSGRIESTCPQSENLHPLGKQEGHEKEKDNRNNECSVTGIVTIISYNNCYTSCELCLPLTDPKKQPPEQCDTPKMGIPNNPIEPKKRDRQPVNLQERKNRQWPTA